MIPNTAATLTWAAPARYTHRRPYMGGMTMDRLVFGVAPDGFPVAECELAAAEEGVGRSALWVHSPADLTGSGFQPREGYRRFTSAACPRGDPLPVLDIETIAGLWPRAFGGQWGHRHVDAATARTFAASGESVFVGLREHGQWTGLCRIEPGERLIDGPASPGRGQTTPCAVSSSAPAPILVPAPPRWRRGANWPRLTSRSASNSPKKTGAGNCYSPPASQPRGRRLSPGRAARRSRCRSPASGKGG